MPSKNLSIGSAGQEAPVLLVIAGPAGSGKTTLCERLVGETGLFSRIVTSTTRPPREGEKDGVHYHFLTPEQFDGKIAAGAFLEWAWVHTKHRYGTLADSVLRPLKEGRSLVVNIDVQGVENFRKAAAQYPLLARHMTTVYVDLPIPVLRERLKQRGTDSNEEIERRMRTAEAEQLQKDNFDFVIESSTRDQDFAALLEICAKARSRVLNKELR